MPFTDEDIEELREMLKAWMDKIIAKTKKEVEEAISAMPDMDEAEKASLLQKEMDRRKTILSLLCAYEGIKLSIPSAERLLNIMPDVIKAVIATTAKDAASSIATNIYFLAEHGFIPGVPELRFMADLTSHATVYAIIDTIPKIVEGIKALLFNRKHPRQHEPGWFGVV